MAETVAEIMDAEPVRRRPRTTSRPLVRACAATRSPACPSSTTAVAASASSPRRDLVIADEQGDLHLPHYIELFGGVVFLESLRRFEERLKKAFASTVEDLMTEDPDTIDVTASVRDAAKLIASSGHNRLPVVEHGRFVGLVTRVDVLDGLAQTE